MIPPEGATPPKNVPHTSGVEDASIPPTSKDDTASVHTIEETPSKNGRGGKGSKWGSSSSSEGATRRSEERTRNLKNDLRHAINSDSCLSFCWLYMFGRDPSIFVLYSVQPDFM